MLIANMKEKIEIAIKWLIYIVFFVPLLVFPSSYIFPFIVPKIIFFRSIVEIMMVLYILLLFINWQQYKPKFNYLNIAIFLFLLSFAISTFVGTDAYHSFWDNHERMLGLFTLIHYVAFYFVCAGVMRDWKDWKLAGRVFLAGGFIVMFIGWLQTQMPELLLNQGSTRVASTLGNSIYVGNYGLFLTFLASLLFSREKNVFWKWFYGIAGIFGFMGMFWSGTRGSLLGLVFGVIFALIGYVVVLKKYPKIRIALVSLMILGIACMSLLYTFRNADFVKGIPGVNRAVSTSLSDLKSSARWIAWEIAVEGWKEKPVFGWGPNNYFYAFNKHYKSRSLDFGYGETWFDNAHNIVLNTLTVQGAFGLFVYFAVYILAIIIFNIQPSRANQKTLDAIRAIMADPIAGMPVVKESLEFTSPHIDDIRSDVSRTVSQSLSSNWQKIGKEKSNALLALTTDNLEKNLLLHPLDIRNQLTLAQMYQLGATMNNNGMFILKAESVLEDALKKSPKRQQIIYSLSGLKMQTNKPAEAIKMLEETIKDNPRIGESYWRLAYAYKVGGQDKKIGELIKKSHDNGVVFTEQEQGILNQLILVSSTKNNLKQK